MTYQPELGQALFGNSWGRYEAPEIVHAILGYLIEEIRRVFWNRFQRSWDEYEDPKISGLEWRPYYWGDDEEEAAKPNFKCKGVELRWYKHPMRGLSVDSPLTSNQWSLWQDESLEVIRRADVLSGEKE